MYLLGPDLTLSFFFLLSFHFCSLIHSILDFSKCSNIDQVSILITDFDQNNFGQLDAFETCAHSFRDDDNHGGHTALGCMK
jgi:hypothetical protein